MQLDGDFQLEKAVDHDESGPPPSLHILNGSITVRHTSSSRFAAWLDVDYRVTKARANIIAFLLLAYRLGLSKPQWCSPVNVCNNQLVCKRRVLEEGVQPSPLKVRVRIR